jgi:hypothetical protein
MPSEMDRYMMRQAGMNQPVKPRGIVACRHLDQQTVTGYAPPCRDGLALKRHPVILPSQRQMREIVTS